MLRDLPAELAPYGAAASGNKHYLSGQGFQYGIDIHFYGLPAQKILYLNFP